MSDTYFLTCRPKDAEKRKAAALLDWVVEEFGAFSRRQPILARTQVAAS